MAGGKKAKGKSRQEKGLSSSIAEPNACYCLVCQDAVDDGPAIECDRCKEWCHKGCTKLNAEYFKLLQRNENEILWVCAGCRESDKEHTGERCRLEAKLDRMMKMMEDLTSRLLELEKERTVVSIDEKIEKQVEKKVNEWFVEEREKDKRKLNVIWVNVPESEGDTGEERQKNDLEKVARMVGGISDVPAGDISEPLRLGRRDIGHGKKPRVLRVTVRTEEAKKKLLANAHKLNEGIKDSGKRVYVNHDRTEREREVFRRLRVELDEKKKDDPDLIIRGGKIVKGREQGKNRQENAVKDKDARANH